MRLFIYDNKIINVDNDQDAKRICTESLTNRELTKEEILQIFGNLAHMAGPDNTKVEHDGKIIFDQLKASNEIKRADIENKRLTAKEKMTTALASGVNCSGRVYACKKIDIESFQQGLTLLNLTQAETIEAYDFNDTPHTLTVQEYREVCKAVGLKYYIVLKTYKTELITINS